MKQYEDTYKSSKTGTRKSKSESNISDHEPSIRLARNPVKAAQEMTDIIINMQDIYERETEALLNADTNSFNKLQSSKMAAAKLYQEGSIQMLERRDEMQAIDPAIKNKLKALHSDFTDMSNKNLEALDRMKRCTERLGDVIRGAAKEAASKQRGVSYSETGHMSKGLGRRVSMGVSETA